MKNSISKTVGVVSAIVVLGGLLAYSATHGQTQDTKAQGDQKEPKQQAAGSEEPATVEETVDHCICPIYGGFPCGVPGYTMYYAVDCTDNAPRALQAPVGLPLPAPCTNCGNATPYPCTKVPGTVLRILSTKHVFKSSGEIPTLGDLDETGLDSPSKPGGKPKWTKDLKQKGTIPLNEFKVKFKGTPGSHMVYAQLFVTLFDPELEPTISGTGPIVVAHGYEIGFKAGDDYIPIDISQIVPHKPHAYLLNLGETTFHVVTHKSTPSATPGP